ncbi:3-hydroxyacyl-CoA dehydrogenase family protein [Micromonospora sp. DT46]|uniref:3-hydroxyacyl-CoA dehydrogenase family protein n=1 Tax=unclassified Micromonospora TaxID=2617518 RepID=UPI00124BAFED|nr:MULTISPECIES: 3-hydroxyacyl-CoA dehydrogenase NAD-binding domain-containing protein [unclassified Micromonospora]KAB1162377.1 3-hydroxybutyryl-CoA dehydrogenase [Micromonospora sp. AMSO12t]WSG01447.1 3-hydroxyacyl-CoA dehydrogenase NAD-binding domain-containing protein [Micromonospora sp. NBC_01740]
MTVIGVVGAGVMGVGVAQNLAQYGYEVVLVDRTEEILAGARAVIARNCRMSRLMGGPALDPDAILARITTAVGVEALDKASAVIENVTENWDIKREVHQRLDEVCPPETVIIVNTSAIPITRVAAVGKHPERVIGVHFMNPVPAKPVVEMIPGFHTSASTIERTRELLSGMGKKAVDVKDASGFVSNRVLMLTVNEAAFLVHEGVATAESVDEVFRGCFGHPMGPLETADLIGVDTILYSVEVLYEHYADSKYRPCPLLKQMTDAGLHGRKTGRGFYNYES